MFLYFDKNGQLKEIINETNPHRASVDFDKIFIYVDGLTSITTNGYSLFKASDGTLSTEKQASLEFNIEIPYNAKRDLKYFEYFKKYLMWKVEIPQEISQIDGLTTLTFRLLVDGVFQAMDDVPFTIKNNSIKDDECISQSQYNYLLGKATQPETTAKKVSYDNSISQLPADNVQDAIDSLNEKAENPTLKTINGESLKGIGDIKLPTKEEVDTEIDNRGYQTAVDVKNLIDANAILITDKGNPNGVATLNEHGKVPSSQLEFTLNAETLAPLFEGDDTIVVDLNSTGQKVEIHIDEAFKQTLATKTYVAEAIAGLSTITIKIVEALPTTGDANTIYFVKKAQAKTQDTYEEYMYINNTWELIGSTQIDLSQYAKITDLDKKLDKVQEHEKVYGTDAQGNQITLQYNKEPIGGGLAQRNNDGTLMVADPVEGTDAVNKQYLEANAGVGDTAEVVGNVLEFTKAGTGIGSSGIVIKKVWDGKDKNTSKVVVPKDEVKKWRNSQKCLISISIYPHTDNDYIMFDLTPTKYFDVNKVMTKSPLIYLISLQDSLAGDDFIHIASCRTFDVFTSQNQSVDVNTIYITGVYTIDGIIGD